MGEKERQNDTAPVILRLDRRTQRQADLSSAEVMRILRKRAAKAGKAKGPRGAGVLLPSGNDSGSDYGKK